MRRFGWFFASSLVGVLLASPQAFAQTATCTPAPASSSNNNTATVCLGLSCKTLGETTMDGDGNNLIACLKDSVTSALLWKDMSINAYNSCAIPAAGKTCSNLFLLDSGVTVTGNGLDVPGARLAGWSQNGAYNFQLEANSTNADGNAYLGAKELDGSGTLLSQGYVDIFADGKIGIGTTTPQFPLDIYTSDPTSNGNTNGVRINAGAQGDAMLHLSYGNNVGDAADIRFWNGGAPLADIMHSQGTLYINNFNASAGTKTGPLALQSNGGDVGIGTATPQFPLDIYTSDPTSNGNTNGVRINAGAQGDAMLHLSYGNNASDAADIRFWHGGAPLADIMHSQNILYINNYNALAGTKTGPLALQSNGGNVGIGMTAPGYTLQVNGSVAGVGAYNALSDARLKKDVVEIPRALDMVEKLRGVRFNWRTEKEREIGKDLKLPVNDPQVGLIAQEVEPILPEAVTTAKDGIKNIQESKIVPVLVEALKEEEAEVKALRERLDALEARQH